MSDHALSVHNFQYACSCGWDSGLHGEVATPHYLWGQHIAGLDRGGRCAHRGHPQEAHSYATPADWNPWFPAGTCGACATAPMFDADGNADVSICFQFSR